MLSFITLPAKLEGSKIEPSVKFSGTADRKIVTCCRALAPPRTSLRWFDPPQTSFGEGDIASRFAGFFGSRYRFRASM